MTDQQESPENVDDILQIGKEAFDKSVEMLKKIKKELKMAIVQQQAATLRVQRLEKEHTEYKYQSSRVFCMHNHLLYKTYPKLEDMPSWLKDNSKNIIKDEDQE